MLWERTVGAEGAENGGEGKGQSRRGVTLEMEWPHLAVQVNGLPHEGQGDEFLGALAPGSREEFS